MVYVPCFRPLFAGCVTKQESQAFMNEYQAMMAYVESTDIDEMFDELKERKVSLSAVSALQFSSILHVVIIIMFWIPTLDFFCWASFKDLILMFRMH